jgi:hypothetical protein
MALCILMSCDPGKKEVRLTYKFRPSQSREYVSMIKISSMINETGKSLQRDNYSFRSTLLEQVIAVIDSTKARISLTNVSEKPEMPISQTGRDESPRAWSIEYLIANNGKILEFFPEDSGSSAVIEAYRNYYEQASPVFPDEPVSENQSWGQTIKLIVKDEGPTSAETKYNVKAFVREAGYDCAVIEYTGNMIIPYRKIEPDGSIMIGLNRIGTKGVIYFGYVYGMIVKQEETYDIQMEGSRIVNGQKTKITASSKMTSSMILTDAGS